MAIMPIMAIMAFMAIMAIMPIAVLEHLVHDIVRATRPTLPYLGELRYLVAVRDGGRSLQEALRFMCADWWQEVSDEGPLGYEGAWLERLSDECYDIA